MPATVCSARHPSSSAQDGDVGLLQPVVLVAAGGAHEEERAEGGFSELCAHRSSPVPGVPMPLRGGSSATDRVFERLACGPRDPGLRSSPLIDRGRRRHGESPLPHVLVSGEAHQ